MCYYYRISRAQILESKQLVKIIKFGLRKSSSGHPIVELVQPSGGINLNGNEGIKGVAPINITKKRKGHASVEGAEA